MSCHYSVGGLASSRYCLGSSFSFRAPKSLVPAPLPSELIETMLDRNLSVTELLSSPALVNSTDQASVKQLLLLAAQDLGRLDIVGMLNSDEQLIVGSATRRTNIEVPEVRPVQVQRKVRHILSRQIMHLLISPPCISHRVRVDYPRANRNRNPLQPSLTPNEPRDSSASTRVHCPATANGARTICIRHNYPTSPT